MKDYMNSNAVKPLSIYDRIFICWIPIHMTRGIFLFIYLFIIWMSSRKLNGWRGQWWATVLGHGSCFMVSIVSMGLLSCGGAEIVGGQASSSPDTTRGHQWKLTASSWPAVAAPPPAAAAAATIVAVASPSTKSRVLARVSCGKINDVLHWLIN